MKKFLTIFSVVVFSNLFAQPPSGKDWRLVFEDNFDYPNAQLDNEWVSQNKASSHIRSSRWRENATTENGALKLLCKKENRASQEWTTGNIWTKKLFKYGYFECRYKYAGAYATNNSFWLMNLPAQRTPDGKKRFEIDINEGHYPNEINTNLHNHTDVSIDEKGIKRHPHKQKHIRIGDAEDAAKPDVSIRLDEKIKTSKIKFVSGYESYFHVREIRVFSPSLDGKYPDIKSDEVAEEFKGLENFARKSSLRTSPQNERLKHLSKASAITDGKLKTSWISEMDEEKFIELDFGSEKEIGCVQFLTGWLDRNTNSYINATPTWAIYYWQNNEWKLLAKQDAKPIDSKTNLALDYHIYALEWNEKELIYYFDGREIDRRENTWAHWESPVWLSLAIVWGAGPITTSLDGTSMDVDYVKIWQENGKEFVKEFNKEK